MAPPARPACRPSEDLLTIQTAMDEAGAGAVRAGRAGQTEAPEMTRGPAR
jgi:hypothetical protein